jgi:general secretion pathway protein H
MICPFSDKNTVVMRQFGDCKGFTLLELIVVLFIISVALGLVAMNVGGALPSSKVKREAREIWSSIRYAKATAQLKNSEETLVIDIENKRYWLNSLEERKKDISETTEIEIEVSTDATETNGQWEILFLPEGGVETDIRAIVLSYEDVKYRLEIDPIVGSTLIE